MRSGEYARDYDEVKALGSAASTARTQAQTDLALFYTDNFLVLWERTLRGIAAANINNIGDSALLFALANMSAADATITAWVDKKHWNFWRPITAIREGENDGNRRTAGDPTWVPLIATPPYPEYTSGANNLTGAMTRTLELFFGDKLTFTVTSTPVNKSITYHRFSDMADDVVDAPHLSGNPLPRRGRSSRAGRGRAPPTGLSATSCGLSTDDEGQPPGWSIGWHGNLSAVPSLDKPGGLFTEPSQHRASLWTASAGGVSLAGVKGGFYVHAIGDLKRRLAAAVSHDG